MATLFVSDVHLSSARPETVRIFIEFLNQQARQATALYLLGDCFDLYLGDDDITPPHPEVIRALRNLVLARVPVYFQQGNHDFLVGKGFVEQTGCVLLPDKHLAEVEGLSVLLMHGDLLCTDDHDYQEFRRYTRQAEVQTQFLALPLAARKEHANNIRQEAREISRLKTDDIMDVNADAVSAVMREHATQWLVHGHTHRPQIHQMQVDGHPATRIVLGDWYEQDSVLRWNSSGPELLGVGDL